MGRKASWGSPTPRIAAREHTTPRERLTGGRHVARAPSWHRRTARPGGGNPLVLAEFELLSQLAQSRSHRTSSTRRSAISSRPASSSSRLPSGSSGAGQPYSERSSPKAASRPSSSASRTIAWTRVGPSPPAAAILRIETPSACALAIAHVRSSSVISAATRRAAHASTAAPRAATPGAMPRCQSTCAPRREDRSVVGRTVRTTERLRAVFCSVTTPTPTSAIPSGSSADRPSRPSSRPPRGSTSPTRKRSLTKLNPTAKRSHRA